MRIIFNFIYFLLFIVVIIAAMFLGGVSGTAGTFYLMSEQGDLQQHLTIVITTLSVLWLISIMLSIHNKKIIRRNKLLARKQAESKAKKSEEGNQ